VLAEQQRVADSRDQRAPWWRWGPYLSERQCGTVREDYSADGRAWDALPHDHARSRAYRWGEDGLLGISDNHGRLCWRWRPSSQSCCGACSTSPDGWTGSSATDRTWPAWFRAGRSRAVSRAHLAQPDHLDLNRTTYEVSYEPGESSTGLFGGNSNWRGPVWFPLNFLLVEALQKFHHLESIFLRDARGRRAVFGDVELFQTDPYWRDCVPFYEYFHGDAGRGVGASHQTGWTALIAKLLEQTAIHQPARREEDNEAAWLPSTTTPSSSAPGRPAGR
jgi:hypothetical protein